MKTWNDNAAQQRHIPPIVPLVTVLDGAAVPTNGNPVTFQVPIIDSRLRVKISVVPIMAAGSTLTVDLTTFASLWLAEFENDESGVWGRLIPCVDIEGTSAAPTAVPANAGVQGYSREFVSAADFIQGQFKILNNITLCTWYLKTRYQPDVGQRFTPEEWREIVGLANPRIVGAPLVF